MFDYREIVRNPDRWSRTPALRVARIVRREMIQDLGLPENSIQTVIYHGRTGVGDWIPEYYVQTTLQPAELTAIFARLNAENKSHSGFPAWQHPGRSELLVLVDGWLIRVLQESQDAPIQVCLGKHDSLTVSDGVEELVKALPNLLPMEVDFAPTEFDARRSATWIDPETGRSCCLAYYGDEERVTRAKTNLARTHKPAPDERFEWSGLFLSYSKAGPSDPVYFPTYAAEDIRKLQLLLLELRGQDGRFPASAEEFNVTDIDGKDFRDPWGRAYHYEGPVAGAPGSYDLRSAGPDGELGTDDDVR